MKKLLAILIPVVILSSCAMHHGTISSSSINRSVKYEDIAYGVSYSNKYFGFGGVSQDALILDAKRELVKSRPLQANEEYANFTIDFKWTFFPFFVKTKVTVSADVIKFLNDSLTDPYSAKYKNKLMGKMISNELFQLGDSVIFDKSNKGVLISFERNNDVRVVYQTKKGRTRTKSLSIYDIYTKHKEYKGYKVGGLFVFSDEYKPNASPKRGRIIGLGLNKVLLIGYYKVPFTCSYSNK